MDNKKEKTTEKTDFQGPVSLDAIFAATKGTKAPETKVDDKTTVESEEAKKAAEAKAAAEAKSTEEIKAEEEAKEKEAAEAAAKAEEAKQTVTPGEETEAFKKAKQLIELGFIEDFAIQTSEEDENGTLISEFVGMTDENLEEIIKIHKQDKANEISSKYLPKGDLKEHQLKVFEILSNGGDLSQIAETPEKALERPFEGFDMEDQQRQIDVRYTDLVHGKGLDHDSAITIIDKEVKSGKIKESSQAIFTAYREAHTKYIDGILEEQKKEKEFKDLNFKENKKALTAKLKESGLKESVYKKVATEYARKNENGEHALIDKLKEALNNPEENHELILHLTDKKLFNEVFKIKASHETQKVIRRLASGAEAKGNKQASKGKQTDVTAPWLKAAQIHNESIKQ